MVQIIRSTCLQPLTQSDDLPDPSIGYNKQALYDLLNMFSRFDGNLYIKELHIWVIEQNCLGKTKLRLAAYPDTGLHLNIT